MEVSFVFKISVPHRTWSVPLTFKRWVIIIYWLCITGEEEFNVLLNEAGVDRAQVTTLTVHARQATESRYQPTAEGSSGAEFRSDTR